MSRIGYNPVLLPSGVSVETAVGSLKVKGPRGEANLVIPSALQVEVQSRRLMITPANGKEVAKNLHGLIRTKIQNTITGVYQGFQKQLAIYGVGYNARVTENSLTLQLGYSHPIVHKAPAGITFAIEEQPKAAGSDLQCFVFVRGHDRELVGQVAATLRAYRPPEPYKGKGIRYWGEYVRRKAGKAAATAGGGAKA
jgi:large subunit ribosomal protein L6